MTDIEDPLLPLSERAVRLLQWIARQHEQGHEWVRWEGDPPCDSWRSLGWLTLIDCRGDTHPEAPQDVRLTDFGWSALGHEIEAV